MLDSHMESFNDSIEKTEKQVFSIEEHIVEIVSDSGEGAQKCGQSFGSISAKMNNGVWTVEIIPAEIQPPARSRAGASGNRIRIGSHTITNMGDEADLVVAFNEQVLYSRIDQKAFKKGTIILLENKWIESNIPEIRQQYSETLEELRANGYDVYEIPMEKECLKLSENPHQGKNMWVLGMLCFIYSRDLEKADAQVLQTFYKKSQKIIDSNLGLMHAGYSWAKKYLGFQFHVPPRQETEPMVVMNGNQALGMGTIAAGIEVCSMYPITPATSVSHYLAETFESAGGVVHQAEDEIAAIAFAIGASYAGKTALTVTSGPGVALKTECIALAVMAEIPLVILDVQRGGPSTGLPTKVEQGDLLATIFGQPGDAPKIVMAASTIEECFHFVVLARKLAETFTMPVFVLSDANLATGVQPFPRPNFSPDWLSPPVDQSPWKKGVRPYEWDEETGISQRPIPGQEDGMFVLTGLAHDEESHVAYESSINQRASNRRSRKLAAFHQTLNPPVINGQAEGDLLIVGWGSTRGSIEEAVKRVQKAGGKVSSLHLRFLSPLEPNLKEIFKKFKKVMTVEINYGDEPHDPLITSDTRRYSQLAWYLRAHTLTEVDYFSNVHGRPINPGSIENRIRKELDL
ncbi:MAG: 2-oxoacid:acceptor oxidoreductase subunit alpha [SAR324 cluster bacterium]|nr:2-oxoacid:acceptor oxidoreductase subunit alpha [SAR324 cluster bacterium]